MSQPNMTTPHQRPSTEELIDWKFPQHVYCGEGSNRRIDWECSCKIEQEVKSRLIAEVERLRNRFIPWNDPLRERVEKLVQRYHDYRQDHLPSDSTKFLEGEITNLIARLTAELEKLRASNNNL